MEEEVKILLNKTYEIYEEPSTEDYIINAFFIIASIVTFICNFVIIHIVVRNKHMQTKTNVLLMNWAINDCFFIATSPWLIRAILLMFGDTSEHRWLFRWGLLVGTLFQFNCAVLLTIMISSTLMNSNIEPDRCVVASFYGFSFCILISQIVSTLNGARFSILMCIVFINLIFVVVMLLFKEINKCIKSLRDPLSNCTVFRLNLARIYYYCAAVSLISDDMSFIFRSPYILHLIFKTLCMTTYFTGLYFLVYIVAADEDFKICFYDLFKPNRISYETGAATNFGELDDEFNQDTCLDIDRVV